jgi:hypothetical protein
MSRLSRRCGSLDLSHPYRFSRPVTGTALHFPFTQSMTCPQRCFRQNLISVTVLKIENYGCLGTRSDEVKSGKILNSALMKDSISWVIFLWHRKQSLK